jgi:WD40 repeat protein
MAGSIKLESCQSRAEAAHAIELRRTFVPNNTRVEPPQVLTPTQGAALHDAFISYSRKDVAFAAALQKGLERYVPPKGIPLPPRRLNVFRDAEDFTGTEYFASVDQHLRSSRRLIVICSPHAHASQYVNDEIRRFAQTHSPADLIPVLVAGLPNNEATPETLSSIAFPEALSGLLQMPLAADYRGFNSATERVSEKRWRAPWYKLLADICGCSRAEIEERERRRRIRQRLAWTASGMAGAAVVGGLLYLAQGQRNSARSFELAQQAMALADSDPELGAERALEAISLANSSSVAASALRVNLAKLPSLQLPIAEGYDLGSPMAVRFSPDRRQMLIVDRQPKARVVDAQTGTTRFEVTGDGSPLIDAQWSPDGTLIAVVDDERKTLLLNSATGTRVAKIDGELQWRRSSSALAAVILTDKTVKLVELDHSGALKQLREVAPRGYEGPRLEPFDSSSRTLSPNGRKLATLSAEPAPARLIVNDLDTGRAAELTIATPASPNGLAWSPDGRHIVVKSLFGFSIIVVEPLRIWFTEARQNEIIVEDVSFSPTSDVLATTDRGGVTTLWSIAEKKKSGEFIGEADRAYKPTFSPDGRFLGVIYANGRGRVFSLDRSPAGGVARLEATWGEISSIDFAPDSTTIVALYERGKLAMWNTRRWFPERRLRMQFDPRNNAGVAEGLSDIRLSPDGPVIGLVRDGNFRGWNAASGEEVPAANAAPKRLADVTAIEKGDYTLRQAGNDVLIVGKSRGSVMRLPHTSDVRSATFNPDGRCVLTSSVFRRAGGEAPADANVARLWDTETGTLLREWSFSHFGPDSAFFLDGERAIVLYDGDAFVFRAPLCGSTEGLSQLARDQIARRETLRR